jgi:hypothetical protein
MRAQQSSIDVQNANTLGVTMVAEGQSREAGLTNL